MSSKIILHLQKQETSKNKYIMHSLTGSGTDSLEKEEEKNRSGSETMLIEKSRRHLLIPLTPLYVKKISHLSPT